MFGATTGNFEGFRWTESIWPHFETIAETITFIGIYVGESSEAGASQRQ